MDQKEKVQTFEKSGRLKQVQKYSNTHYTDEHLMVKYFGIVEGIRIPSRSVSEGLIWSTYSRELPDSA